MDQLFQILIEAILVMKTYNSDMLRTLELKTATRVPSIDRNVKRAKWARPACGPLCSQATCSAPCGRLCSQATEACAPMRVSHDPPMALSKTDCLMIRGEQIIQY